MRKRERERGSVKIKFCLSTPSPSQHVHGYVRVRAYSHDYSGACKHAHLDIRTNCAIETRREGATDKKRQSDNQTQRQTDTLKREERHKFLLFISRLTLERLGFVIDYSDDVSIESTTLLSLRFTSDTLGDAL